MLAADHILATLNHHRVDYIIIGALAATLQGSPLRTDDVDICPSLEPSNLSRLGRALTELGAKEWDPRKDEFSEREFTAEFLRSDSLFMLVTDRGALDLVFEPAGTRGYKDLSRDAVTIEIDGLEVRVASIADVIRSKEAANRERDREQLPTLRRLMERLEEND
ncbi:MAG: hypothetical protein ACRDKB_02280 [Actinomycetota bacterium]